MALTVTVGARPALTTTVSAAPSINTTVKKVDIPLVDLEKLKNVDITTNGLDDGFTLVYDTVTEKWVAQSLEEGVSVIDGGTY